MGAEASVEAPTFIMIDKFIKIFEGLERAYGQFKKENNRISLKVEGRPWVTKKPVTKELWENHLQGVGPNLGIFPLKDDGTCKWGAIDIDDNNYDYQDLLNRIRKLTLPLIVFRSKSGRAHVYMFMKDFSSAEEVQLVMKKFAAKLGLGDILDRIYPLQTKISEGDFGSWLNMPYYNHEEGSTFAYKDDFSSASVDEFFEMYDKYVQTDITQYLVEEIQKEKKPKQKTIEDFFIPCVTNCLKENGKIPSVNRNEFLLHMMVWSKKAVEKGITKIDAYSKMDEKTLLKNFNKEFMEDPLAEDEIEKTIFKSADRNYNYSCKKPNIKKWCDPSACVRHMCGIAPEKAEEIKKVEEALGQIVEFCSKPPVYYESLDVKSNDGEGYRRVRVKMSGSEIINKEKYINKLADAGHFPHITVLEKKPKEFVEMQYARLDKRIFEKAEKEASDDYEFITTFYGFVNQNTVSFDKEHLLLGTCYVNQENKELDFKLDRFFRYLKSQKDNSKPAEVIMKLKEVLGARKIRGTVFDKGLDKDVSCVTWRVTSDPEQYKVLGDDAKKIGHDEEN